MKKTNQKSARELAFLRARATEAEKRVEAARKQARLAKARHKQARKALRQAKKAAKEARKQAKAASKQVKAAAGKKDLPLLKARNGVRRKRGVSRPAAKPARARKQAASPLKGPAPATPPVGDSAQA